MFSFFLGLTAGFIHVLSGPDHLAAVAPLSFEGDRGKKSWITGALWGVGHTGGVLFVGTLAILFRESLPIDRLSAVSERLVGVTLIAIGLWGINKAYSNLSHTHEHEHKNTVHEHTHIHGATAHKKPEPHAHTHMAFAVGTLHGFAGSSHFLGVLPALALPYWQAIIYLAGFGIGSILGMTGFAWLAGIASSRVGISKNGYWLSLTGLSGITVVVGILWLVI